jgi:hypothetical protein
MSHGGDGRRGRGVDRLQELEDLTDQTNLESRAAHDATAEDRGFAEEFLDRAPRFAEESWRGRCGDGADAR